MFGSEQSVLIFAFTLILIDFTIPLFEGYKYFKLSHLAAITSGCAIAHCELTISAARV